MLTSRLFSKVIRKPSITTVAKNAQILERAMHPSSSCDLFFLLIHLMPNVQSECKLRMLCALEEFKLELNAATQRAKGRKIKSMFLHSGAPYEVQNIPSHLVKMEVSASCNPLQNMLLTELCELEEVQVALHTAASVNQDDEEEEELHQSYSSNSHSVVSTNGNLAVMAQLEQVIANARTRHVFVNKTLGLPPTKEFGIKIRFVAVMDQCLRVESLKEAVTMGKKIGSVFFQDTSGMFHIDLEDEALMQAAALGKLESLEEARLEVLKELSLSPDIVHLLNNNNQ